jgi:hypothetical protein
MEALTDSALAGEIVRYYRLVAADGREQALLASLQTLAAALSALPALTLGVGTRLRMVSEAYSWQAWVSKPRRG